MIRSEQLGPPRLLTAPLRTPPTSRQRGPDSNKRPPLPGYACACFGVQAQHASKPAVSGQHGQPFQSSGVPVHGWGSVPQQGMVGFDRGVAVPKLNLVTKHGKITTCCPCDTEDKLQGARFCTRRSEIRGTGLSQSAPARRTRGARQAASEHPGLRTRGILQRLRRGALAVHLHRLGAGSSRQPAPTPPPFSPALPETRVPTPSLAQYQSLVSRWPRSGDLPGLVSL